jgi:anti-sigma factor RsiW
VSVPNFPNATAAGARILQVRDKPAAYIRYETPHQQMGLFVFPDDDATDVGAEPEVSTIRGYNVVSWREGGVVYQLVTDLDDPEIRQLVPRRSGPSSGRPKVVPASLQR